MKRKGIVLAGGNGSRLYPVTMSISKQLLPVFDRPMIYYPLSILMTMGIKDILIISTPESLPLFKHILNNGNQWGIKIDYVEQESPRGLAEAFIIGESFIDNNPVTMVLGDNIFYGPSMDSFLQSAYEQINGATVFGYNIHNPQSYGVAEFDQNIKIIDIEEKPQRPKSNCAITGLYFYDSKVVHYAKKLKPSPRGELEITDLNKHYLKEKTLSLKIFDKRYTWFDMGTSKHLLDASKFVYETELDKNLKIACLEEIAFNKKWIGIEQVKEMALLMKNSSYGNYLINVVKRENN